jgi:hypothetical protein
MRFRSPVWIPVAWILSGVNIAATFFAARDAEPMHTLLHAALGVAFALWAERLRRRGAPPPEGSLADMQQQIDEWQAESRGQIAELHERLDFAERFLQQQRAAQGVRPPESPRE